MISRTFLPLLAVLTAVFFTSCGNSGLTLLPKSRIGYGNENIQLPPPSPEVLAAAQSKPKDRHQMPVYAFSERRRVVRTTAYACTEDDHLIYGNKNATGTQLRYSSRVRSAAADWSFYPVGTTFRIKGMPQLYVVDDYGSALTGTGTIDIYKPTKGIMDQWGRRTVEVTIVQWGSFTRSVELLGQRVKFPHCRQMLSNILRQRPDLSGVAKR